MSRHTVRLFASVILAAGVLTVPTAVTTPSAEAGCRASLQSLSLAKGTVVGGASTTATVRLSCRAAKRTKVRLAAGTGIRVPAHVYVARGRSSGQVTVRTSPTTARSSGTVKATLGRQVRRRTLVRTVTPCYPTPVPKTVTLPSYVHAGTATTGSVTLDCVAKSALAVSLTSSSSSVTVPATLTVAAGRRTASFRVVTKAPATGSRPAYDVTVRATRNRKSAARVMQVRPEIRAFRAGDRFTVNEPVLTPEGTDGWLRGTLRITLDHPAPAGGLDVKGVRVPAGGTWAEATIYHLGFPPDSRVTDRIVISDSAGRVLVQEEFTYVVRRGS